LSNHLPSMAQIEASGADTDKNGLVVGPDPELEQLPAPRHPWRRTTLLTVILCFLASLTLLFGIREEVAYSFGSGPPQSVGPLVAIRLSDSILNRWVQAEGDLADHGGIRYQRPFESDSFRLVPVLGNPRLWVQIRVPAGFEDQHFVPPTSFVGRLTSIRMLGVRYSALSAAIVDAGWPKGQLPEDAWILFDGESPKSIRWVLALSVVLVGFAGFSLWAMVAALRPAHSP